MDSTNSLPAALGLLETTGFTPAIVALDVMEKAANVTLWQAELNDFLGVIIKMVGPTADVHAAISAGHKIADIMQGKPVSRVIDRPDPEGQRGIASLVEYNQLIEQFVVHEPTMPNETTPPDALGLIETQGFTAVFAAIDTACKAAGVEVVGKEKLGGGFVTVIVRGDVAAVNAAIDAGKGEVAALGKLIAAHVITRPSPSVMSLLPSA